MRKKMYIAFIITVLLDQITKFIAVKYITNITIIPKLLSFIYTENRGAAFSIFSNKQMFLVISSMILLLALVYMYKKEYKKHKDSNLYNIVYGVIFGGIIGNMLDRIIRNYVVDFIFIRVHKINFPVFNLADVYITVGVIVLLVYLFTSDE